MDRLQSLLREARSEAARTNHRFGLVLAGNRQWCRAAAMAALAAPESGRCLWVGADSPAEATGVDNQRLQTVLGSECNTLVYDAWCGFDPDGFGAATGTLVGGGLLLLIAPPLEDWPTFPDPQRERIATHPYRIEQLKGRFIARLARLIRDSRDVLVVEPGKPLPPAPAGAARQAPETPANPECRTHDQAAAVDAVESAAFGDRYPLVLTSDRGRGKSAALGIGAAHVLRRGAHRVVITAPRLLTANTAFTHAARLLPGARQRSGQLHWEECRFHFAAPDSLLHDPVDADLLLVDEAASIPTPVLQGLLERYRRVVFATTVHGYEGTGRGFAVRFRDVLDRRTPEWREIRLKTPIRWSADDPLERFVFRALLLDAEPPRPSDWSETPMDTATVARLDRDRLAVDEQTLSELFGLLVTAHYQTRPLDLRNLLEGPAVEVWAASYGGHIAGAAIVAREGGLDSRLTRQSWLGRRRPRGHLIPESLISQSGHPEAGPLHGARIMRIAVDPAMRRRGLGRRLVHAIRDTAAADGLDYTGSCFGATPDLLDFWHAEGFVPVRLGSRREAASGTYSVMVLNPITAAAHQLVSNVRERFLESLPVLLNGPATDVEPELRERLGPPREHSIDAPCSDQDWQDLLAFAFGNRLDDHCLLALVRLQHLAQRRGAWQQTLTARERDLYQRRIDASQPWYDAATSVGLTGRRQGIQTLRNAVRRLLEDLTPDTLREPLNRLRAQTSASMPASNPSA